MLNDFLYRALEAAFGSVLVENLGEHAEVQRDWSSPYTAAWRMPDDGAHGEQYRVNCPFCRNRAGLPDRNHHLYVSYLSYARPVVGGVELETGPLMAHCFRRDCMSDPGNRDALAAMIGAGMACVGDGMSTSASVVVPPSATWPESGEPKERQLSRIPSVDGIREWVPAYTPCSEGCDDDIALYLTGRGVDADMAEEFMLGWGRVVTPRTGTALNGGVPWVIAPVVMNGELKGVQARCPDSLIPEGGLRYWIHPGMRKKAVVYNLDRARAIGTGVLCEGVFDVMKVGAPGVCCFGHIPSRTQKELLASIGGCLVMLPDTDPHEDFDTVEEARELAADYNAAGVFGLGAHVVVLPAKDPGEMDRQDVWTCIVQQVPPKVQEHLIEKVLPNMAAP